MQYYIINEFTNKIVMKSGRAVNISALHEKMRFEVMRFKSQADASLWLMKGKNKSLKGFAPIDEATLADKLGVNFVELPKRKDTEAKVASVSNTVSQQKPQVSEPVKATAAAAETLGLTSSANIDETVNTVFINETLELLEHLASMKARWAKVLAKAPADIRRVDAAITDALHLTEFRQLTPDEAIDLVNKVHDNRVERRRLKNEAAVAQNAATLLNAISNEELMRSIYFIRNMGTRKYTPRTGEFFETTEQEKAEG